MTKIKSFRIGGLRGIRSELSLKLDAKSILLFGDNGSGKSSISDAFEWFYRGKIEHLASEEIGRSGTEALRNVFLDDHEKGFIDIDYTNKELDSDRSILLKENTLISEHSNESKEFVEFLKASTRENLILRYRDLVTFILATKTDKLDELSRIIGFRDVSVIRATLRKALNKLRKELKPQSFDDQIGKKQAHIIEHLGQNVTSNGQFVEAVNKLIKPLDLEKKITDINEVDAILELIKTPEDTKIVELQSFYNRTIDMISSMPDELGVIEASYGEYVREFHKIAGDPEQMKSIIFERLLLEGERVLKSETMTEDKCPLCLLPKSRSELLTELEGRIDELGRYKTEREKLATARENLSEGIEESQKTVAVLLSNKHLKMKDNEELKRCVEELEARLGGYLAESELDIAAGKSPKPGRELHMDRSLLDRIVSGCKEELEKVGRSKKNNLKFDVHSKLALSRAAYTEIRELRKEKEQLERQEQALSLVYEAFIYKQKQGIQTFLDTFSESINNSYQFMNPDENIEDINLVPLMKNDELIGITMEFRFYEKEEKPPQKYLSESHLNCLGIAFFLASVTAFNKENGFFILDDVISSFDSTHRKRLADMLAEKFSDYQIVLLTHERNWFEYVRNTVQGRNWKVGTIRWSEDRGTYVDEPIEDLRERIERKVAANVEEGLGTDTREYLEQLLKNIALNTKVKVEFLFNDRNEDRMSRELVTCLKARINKQPSEQLKNDATIDRLLPSLFVGNKNSHDSSFVPSIGDLKAFWNDVKDLEKLFRCESCLKYVSMKYYDEVSKRIRCGCGALSYSWRK